MIDRSSVTAQPSDDADPGADTDCFQWCPGCGGTGSEAAAADGTECWWCRGAGVVVGVDSVSRHDGTV